MRFGPVVAPGPHPSVVQAELDGSLVLFHLGDRRLHVLNDTAAAIWHELAEAQTIGDLSVGLGDRFDVAPQSIRADVQRTLAQFHNDGLLSGDDRGRAVEAASSGRSTPFDGADAPATGSYAALDARVALSCDDNEITDTLARVLSPLESTDVPTMRVRIEMESERAWSVAVGDATPVSVGSRLAVVLRAIGEVNNVAVASSPNDLVFHAGAVGNRSGVVLLPAGSNHGKSTLTAALVRTGLGYLSDEVAAVTAGFEVRPFPRAIALDPGSFPLFPDLAPAGDLEGLHRALNSREWHIDPATVGTRAARGPVRVIVCPQWRPGVATRLHRNEPIEALHELIGDAFDFRAGGQPVFQRLVALIERVPVYRLGYSEVDEAVAVIDALLHDLDAAPC